MSKITVVDGLVVSLVAMSIVFLILLIIMICLKLLGYLKKFDKPTPKMTTNKVETRQQTKEVHKLDVNDEDMVVACLVATIEANNDLGCNMRVVSVKQI